MAVRRCVLCDGKVVNQRCVECGMDFSRWENRYRLNEDGSFEKVNKSQSTGTAQQRTQNYHTTQQKVRVSEEEKRRREKAVRDARAKRMSHKANQKTRKEYGASKPKKKAGGKLVLLIFLIGLAVDLAGAFFDNFSFGSNEVTVEREPEEAYVEDAAENGYEYDPYAYVVSEMPEEGETYTVELGKGSYYGGKHVPVGTYTATLLNDDGYGNVALYDDANLIYFYKSLDYDGVKVLEDVRLYEGTELEIEGNITVLLESENAQVSSMQEQQENPLTASVSVTGQMAAGEDFEPGIYDIQVKSGYGTVTRTVAGADYYDWYTWLNIEHAEESVYLNMELTEGDIIAFDDYSSDDFAVELVPSAAVYP